MFENVVVGAVDVNGATRALRRASEVTSAAGGTLHIVAGLGAPQPAESKGPWSVGSRAVRQDAQPLQTLLHRLRDLATDAHVKVATHPVSAEPADAITRVALQEDADLIVLGSRGEVGDRQLSAVTKAVLDQASCAVLVV